MVYSSTFGTNKGTYVDVREITTDYTLVPNDHGKEIRLNASTGKTITCPANKLGIGFRCRIVQWGAGPVTIASDGTSTIRSLGGYVITRGQYSAVELETAKPNEFLLTALSWVRRGGYKRVTANVTNATATMSNISDLSIPLDAGAKYAGSFSFIANNSTAGDGLQFDFNGGSATFTNIEFMFRSTPPGVTLGTTVSTAAGTAITATAATTTDVVYTVFFTCVCNAAGTLIPRFAEVSHTTGTATLVANSVSQIVDFS